MKKLELCCLDHARLVRAIAAAKAAGGKGLSTDSAYIGGGAQGGAGYYVYSAVVTVPDGYNVNTSEDVEGEKRRTVFGGKQSDNEIDVTVYED